MTRGFSSRKLKAMIPELLRSEDVPDTLERLCELPARKVINPLISFFLHTDDLVRWRSISAVGAVTEHLAQQDRESARVIMRRLMWMLNDESGGIGWGAPEAMAEVMARDEKMADEFSSILISYMDEEGNYLEYEPLQRGLLWGVYRLATERPDIISEYCHLVAPYLESSDAAVRGLAALAAGKIGAAEMKPKIELLTEDETPLQLYRDGHVHTTTVGTVAREALNDFETGACSSEHV
jgi:HEAT repeat protein